MPIRCLTLKTLRSPCEEGCLAYGHWRRSLTIAVAAELRLRQRTETATRPDRDAQFRAPVAFRVLELSAPDIEAKNLKMKKEQGADL